MKRTIFRLAIGLILISVLLGCFYGCGEKNLSITMDLLQLPEDLDPQTTDDAMADLILVNVMEGLTRLDASGEVVLAAAERYEVSKDGLTWRFALRDSAWSDGEKVRPEDFVFAFRRLFSPSTGAPEKAGAFSAIANAQEVMNGTLPEGNIGVYAEENTVVFQLSREEPDFLRLLASRTAMPCREDFFEETAGSYGLSRKKLLFNGPYVIQYWLEDEYVILAANSHYRGDELVCRKVVMNLASNESEIVKHFRDKETNFCRVQTETVPYNEKEHSRTLYEETVWCLVMQRKRAPLSDVGLRRALISCYDSSLLPTKNAAGYHPVSAIMPSAIPERPTETPISVDSETGKICLKEFLKKNNLEKLSALTITMPEEGNHREMLAQLQQAWQSELGVYVNLKILPQKEWTEVVSAGDFELALIPASAESGNPYDFVSKFATGQEYDCFGLSQKVYDSAVKSGAGQDRSMQNEVARTCCDLLWQSEAILPLYASGSGIVYAKELQGIEISPFGGSLYFATAGRPETIEEG